MQTQRHKQIVQIAKLYYSHQKTQQEIAELLGISRPTVSRLLNEAIENKIVTFTIHDDQSDILSLEETLRDTFHLKTVKIANIVKPTYDYVLEGLGSLAADYIQSLVISGDIIGVSWGKTIYEVSKHLTNSLLDDITVVQLKGGVSQSTRHTYSYETIDRFARAFNTSPILLNLPVIFDSHQVKEAIQTDSHIHEVLQLGKRANISIFTVGTVREDAMLFQLNYLSKKEIAELRQHAVGDICSRFFNARGEIANPELNARTIGLELDAFKDKEHAILVAGGSHKLEAIHGALIGGYCNELVTDIYTAKQLLQLKKK